MPDESSDYSRNIDGKPDGQDDFPDRLRFARGDMAPAELARALGVSSSTVSDWGSGKTQPKSVQLFALAETLGVDPKWLATGDGFWQPERSNLVLVPRLDLALAAGSGAWRDRVVIIGSLAFDRDYLAKLGAPDGKGLFVLDVDGDSMEPTIRDGAVAVVNTRNLRYSDGIWGIAIGDNLRVKRLRRGVRSLQVISDNPNYPPEEITEAEQDQLHLIGRVQWVGQSF